MKHHLPTAVRTQTGSRAPRLWILALAVLLLLTQYSMTYVPDRIDPGSGSGEDSIFRRQVSIPLLGFLGAVFFFSAKGWRRRWYRPLFVIGAALFTWIVLSLQWTSYPSLATRRIIILMLLFAGAYGTVVKWPRGVLLPLVVFSAGLQLTVGLVSEVLYGAFSAFDQQYRFAGNLGPNGEGTLCAVLALASIAAARSSEKHKMLYWSVAGYGLLFLLLTRSLTSLAGFLAGITAYSFLQFSSGGKLRFVYLGFMILASAGFLLTAHGFSIEPVAELLGRDAEGLTSFTGRIPLWAECMKYVRARPIIGNGYESMWPPDGAGVIETEIAWLAGSAHSAYIDLWLALGIVGLMLHTSLLLLVLRRAAVVYRTARVPEYAVASALSVQYLVFGLFESFSLIRFSSILFFAYCLFLAVALADSQNRRLQEKTTRKSSKIELKRLESRRVKIHELQVLHLGKFSSARRAWTGR